MSLDKRRIGARRTSQQVAAGGAIVELASQRPELAGSSGRLALRDNNLRR